MKIHDQVENILKVSHSARNSDKALLLIYLQKSRVELSKEQIAVFNKLPAFETITRIRRILQEQGKYEPSEQVKEERYKKYQSVRQEVHHENVEELLEKQGYIIRDWGE